MNLHAEQVVLMEANGSGSARDGIWDMPAQNIVCSDDSHLAEFCIRGDMQQQGLLSHPAAAGRPKVGGFPYLARVGWIRPSYAFA